jgi:nucleotide-binding universal stress UspA family protein
VSTSERTVVVGLASGEADAVLLVAAAVAAQFDAELVCVLVDVEHYTRVNPDGTTVRYLMDPDSADDDPDPLPALQAHLHDVLGPAAPAWSLRSVDGEPSAALAAVAAEVSALMIVIGTRRRTVQRSLREFFTGSIAAHLAHRQPRPVLVVPLDPVLDDADLPWSDSGQTPR